MDRLTLDELFETLLQAKENDYIGEAISQLDHALQAAYFAQKSGGSTDVIIACLFHDLGHLKAPSGSPRMENLGVADHESIGAGILESSGFNSTICDLVKNHVLAKRYLVSHDSHYANQLSPASKRTLELQGGPINTDQKKEYESHPLFEQRLLVRRCDEMAKRTDLNPPPLDHYRSMVESSLQG